MTSSRTKRTVAVLSLAGVFVGGGISAAYAGEITGHGDSLKVDGTDHLHGKSPCAFSGLNDDYINGDLGAPHTQTPKGAGSFTGFACNPNNPFEG